MITQVFALDVIAVVSLAFGLYQTIQRGRAERNARAYRRREYDQMHLRISNQRLMIRRLEQLRFSDQEEIEHLRATLNKYVPAWWQRELMDSSLDWALGPVEGPMITNLDVPSNLGVFGGVQVATHPDCPPDTLYLLQKRDMPEGAKIEVVGAIENLKGEPAKTTFGPITKGDWPWNADGSSKR